MAVDRSYKNSKGERETDFIPVVVWRNLAKICVENLDKGSLVGITGSIIMNNWDDEEGNKRRSFQVIANKITFLEKRKG